VQARQSGWSRLPPWTGLVFPQDEHSAHRCWQRRHHGRPVAAEVSHGASRPQIEHLATGTGRHASQSGPSGVRTQTLRFRPHWAHSSRFAGSLARQYGQIGSPFPSRAAGSFMVPQRAHAWTLVLATQLRQHHSSSIRR
jgi:hypothetical protein